MFGLIVILAMTYCFGFIGLLAGLGIILILAFIMEAL